MSRHKLVKQLDLGEELDDYDGGADYDETDDEGEITVECCCCPTDIYGKG